MLNKLLSASNAVYSSKDLTFNGLVKERSALKRKNILASGLAGFLAVVSTLSINSCRSNAKTLEQAHSENADLKQMVGHFQKDAADLFAQNQDLKPYKDFVDTIEPFYPDMVDGKTDAEEKQIEQQNTAEQKKWNGACKTLGINPAELMRLKEME